MKPLRIVAFTSLMAAASFAAHAKDILIGGTAIQDNVETKVLAIDMATRVVTVDGPDNKPVDIQVSEKAKSLENLKVGDTVNLQVSRSVATVLDTTVGGEPGASKEAGVIRATKDNPNPGGEAFRQIKITSKITKIDLNSHEVTLLPPEGPQKVVKVEDPELQKKMDKLEVGQTVDIIYTDIVTITTSH